ncbi:MAG: DUF362 domain-containing protein [Candidatus Heimdallarchaeota archaeon]
MKPSTVYYYKNVKNLKACYNKFFSMITEEVDVEEKIGIKIHFGAQNNDTHIDPKQLKDIKKYFKRPIFVESNCLYPVHRHRSDEHIKIAHEHGFDFLPIDILDGDVGLDYEEIEINTKNTKKALMSIGLRDYDNLISIAHFKGHITTGFSGALKNLGMGLGSRGGKMDIHAGVSPRVNADKCTACGICAEECIAEAIDVSDYAIIDPTKCIGCAMCIAVCPERIIRVPMRNRTTNEFLEKVVEYAYAGIMGHNWWFINALTNITMKCDCMRIKQEPFMDDIGIHYSTDPIAIDQASIDLVIMKNSLVNPFNVNHKTNQQILKYGEKLGLGKRDYVLEYMSDCKV